MQASTYRGKIQELEGLRGVAIAFVIIHHFWPLHAGGVYEQLFSVAHLGWIGVDLFFVISGLLIGGILLDTKGEQGYFRNFYGRRVVRIFPLYYLLVITAFVTVPIAQAYLHKVGYLQTDFVQQSGNPLWYLLFMGNVREAIHGVEPAYVLAPLWSISIEEQFYLCAPLLIVGMHRRHLATVLGGFMVLAPLFRYWMFKEFPDNERIQYLATLSRFDNLSIGLLLAIILRSDVSMKPGWLTGSLVVLSAAFVAIFLQGGFNRYTFFCRVWGYSFLALYFATWVLWALTHQGRSSTAWLRNAVLMKLGSLCYGIYLLQRPAEIFLVKGMALLRWNVNAWPLLSMGAKSASTILLAMLSWRFIEQPINQLKARFKSAKHPMNIGAAG